MSPLSWTGCCRPDDPYRALNRATALITRMIAEGYTGRKGKGGFYRASERTARGSRRPSTSHRRLADRAGVASLAAAKAGRPARAGRTRTGGRYAWRVLSETLAYAAELVPRSATTSWRRSGDAPRLQLAVRAVRADRPARRRLAGYGWRPGGPCRALRRPGRTFYRVQDGRLSSARRRLRRRPRPDGVLSSGHRAAQRRSAALWDIGDGVACLEFTRQDERAGRRHASSCIADAVDRARRGGLPRRWWSTTRARTSRSAPISASPCSRPTSPLWDAARGDRRQGASRSTRR